MFDKVTRSLLQQTDQGGTLISVSRLNDSEKLKPLAVVIKCPATRFWQSTKYRVTDFTLNDLLQGKPINPVLKEQVFLNNYEETMKGSVAGSGEVDAVGEMKAQGHGTSKILSSLGKLLKESVIMQRFLEDSKDRKIDPQHNLITQLQGKNEITVVKERIFTTGDCKINVSELKEGSWSALLNILSPTKIQLYSSICLESSRAIDIPPHTVMAYSVSELNIESDGHYDIGVMQDGIEADDNLTDHLPHNETEVDSFWPLTQITEGSSLSALNKELASVKATLCELSCLPAETRITLLNLFQKILPDQELLYILEDVLEKMCAESKYDSHRYLPDTSNELTDGFLDLLKSESSLKSPKQTQLILTAMHTLISAAGELTDDGLALIKIISSDTINGLNELVTLLTKPSQRVRFSELPFSWRDGEVPEEIELLFILSNITLKRENQELYAEIGSGSKVLPVVLCIVVHGLALLNESCETDI